VVCENRVTILRTQKCLDFLYPPTLPAVSDDEDQRDTSEFESGRRTEGVGRSLRRVIKAAEEYDIRGKGRRRHRRRVLDMSIGV